MTTLVHFFNSTLSRTSTGIALALVSNALFVSVGIIVRCLSCSIDVFQILFFRQLIFLIVLLPAIYKNIGTLLKPQLMKFHALRVSAAFLALLLSFITVSNIPLAEATALGFMKVLFVAILSTMLLGESVGKSRQLTIIVGFIGVVLVVQPSFEEMDFFYTFTGLGAAGAAAVAVYCVRKIASKQPTINLLVYQALFVGVLVLPPSLFFWRWPTVTELCLLVLVGLISSLAQWLAVAAYKISDANVISNVEYSQMIYSLLLGYMFFSEIPNILSLIGVLTIFVSAFLPFLSEKGFICGRGRS